MSSNKNISIVMKNVCQLVVSKQKCLYFALPLKTRDFSSSFFHPCTLCRCCCWHPVSTLLLCSSSLSSWEFVCCHQKAADFPQEEAAAVQVWTHGIIQRYCFPHIFFFSFKKRDGETNKQKHQHNIFFESNRSS